MQQYEYRIKEIDGDFYPQVRNSSFDSWEGISGSMATYRNIELQFSWCRTTSEISAANIINKHKNIQRLLD